MDENARLAMWQRFAAGFETEPEPDERAPEAPPMPTQSYLAMDTYDDFMSLGQGSNTEYYAATAIMAVQPFGTTCYPDVRPGAMFLFPGTYDTLPLPYVGDLSLDCRPQQALLGDDGPLHAQLCGLLGAPATVFVGFSLAYPLNEATVGYTSGTCNTYWFGSRVLPDAWQAFVLHSLMEQIWGR